MGCSSSADRSQRGFTMIELLIGASVAAVGLYATMQLAIAALNGNTERRDSIAAEQLAQHLLATIQTDGVMWFDPMPMGKYLSRIQGPPGTGPTSGWLLPLDAKASTDKRVGGIGWDKTYDGGLMVELPQDQGTLYCTHFRLTWVTTDLIRAEVRVSWPRRQLAPEKYADCPAEMAYDVGNVGSVTLPAMVMRNVYVQ